MYSTAPFTKPKLGHDLSEDTTQISGKESPQTHLQSVPGTSSGNWEEPTWRLEERRKALGGGGMGGC